MGGYVGSARYKPALLPACPIIRVLSYSNCQRSIHSISKRIFRKLALLRVNQSTLVAFQCNQNHSLLCSNQVLHYQLACLSQFTQDFKAHRFCFCAQVNFVLHVSKWCPCSCLVMPMCTCSFVRTLRFC